MSLDNNSTLLNNILTKVNNLPSAGTSLNFTVVGGTSQPSNPTENTIWVNTSTTISGWVFSPTAPTSPSPNSVWFCVGLSSGVGFNAIINNGIELYPLYAKQYISGAWVNKTAKSRQDGKWVEWDNSNIFISGTGAATPLTSEGYGFAATAEYTNDYILLNSQESGTRGIGTVASIDFTGYSTLTIEYKTSGSDSVQGVCEIRETKTGNIVSTKDFTKSSSKTWITIDIFSLSSGKYYICFYTWNYDKIVYIYNVKLER